MFLDRLDQCWNINNNLITVFFVDLIKTNYVKKNVVFFNNFVFAQFLYPKRFAIKKLITKTPFLYSFFNFETSFGHYKITKLITSFLYGFVKDSSVTVASRFLHLNCLWCKKFHIKKNYVFFQRKKSLALKSLSNRNQVERVEFSEKTILSKLERKTINKIDSNLVTSSVKEKDRVPGSKTKHERFSKSKHVRQFSERGKRLRFVNMKMLNYRSFASVNAGTKFRYFPKQSFDSNLRFMWYDRRVAKNNFVSNVHQHLFTGVNLDREPNLDFLYFNQRLNFLYPTNLDKMSFLSSDLANLGLSLKTYTFFKQKGIHKIGDLLQYSQKSLLQLLNNNKEMFVEVKHIF